MADWAREHGYHVAGERVRTPFGEIDLLLRRRRGSRWPWRLIEGWLWIAAEVKTSQWSSAPEQAADERRVHRLRSALQRLAPVLRPPPRTLRVDVIGVRWPIENATRPEVLHFAGTEFEPAARAHDHGRRARRIGGRR